jgi:hypothetical protein
MDNLKDTNMSIKKNLGQFFTTNYKYILRKMIIPNNVVNIIEPFAGNCDLINFIENKDKYNIELYDIEPKREDIIEQDTLNNPPNYDNKFILTNPPYLARNKNKYKDIYNKYDCNDLYKCFIKILIDSSSIGGIIIVPLNFLCSIRKADIDLRRKFIEKFDIIMVNIFEEKVFDDTKYSVCSIFFKLKKNKNKNIIEIHIYPKDIEIYISLTKKNNFTIGGRIYNLPQNNEYKIERATKNTQKNKFITNILLKCIDDNINSKICLKMVQDKDRFIDNTPKLSARSYCTLVFNKEITLEKQEILVNKFNEYLNKKREKYHSLFLNNYRESNTIARKRISFDLVFKICSYLLLNE